MGTDRIGANTGAEYCNADDYFQNHVDSHQFFWGI